MAKLIDADKFPPSAVIQWVEYSENLISIINKPLSEIPAVDPVKHSHIYVKYEQNRAYHACSACDCEVGYYDIYCRNCGSKLDEVVDDVVP